MEKITVQLGSRSYPIFIGEGLLRESALFEAYVGNRQILVVSNEIVAPLYLDEFCRVLPDVTETLILPDGESHKNLVTFGQIIDRLIHTKFHRDACLIALGGGVVGDIVGFAAACYQRGIDFVQVPTTLLAQVDSSVGGKTAVNHPSAKNMIGAFHQPQAVIADTGTLATLPRREFSAGLAEIIKYGLIVDQAFFEWLETNIQSLMQLDSEALSYAVKRCCEIKAQIVAEDEREKGARALLNLGHTFGHGLEALGGYSRWLHGEAVAMGMSMAARMSYQLKKISLADCESIDALLRRADLPVVPNTDIDVDALLAAMALDKKAGNSGLRLILLSAIGSAVIEPAPSSDFMRSVLVEHLST